MREQNVKWVSHYWYSTFTYSKYFHFVLKLVYIENTFYVPIKYLLDENLCFRDILFNILKKLIQLPTEKSESTITNQNIYFIQEYKIVFQTFYTSYNVNFIINYRII